MAISVKNNCAIKTGLFPELAVTAPAGSTIDLMISSVVVQTYTLGTAETTHTFYDLTVGTTYTVSATDGSRTATRTVLIDENAKFGVGIAFQTYLYDEGDECTALTGGYSPQTFSTGTTGISRTKNNDSLEIDRTSVSNNWVAAGYTSDNMVDLSGFTSLKFSWTGTKSSPGAVGNYYYGVSLSLSKTWSDVWNPGIAYDRSFFRIVDEYVTETIDISGLSENSAYIQFFIQNGGISNNCTCKINKIWLE